MSKLRVENGGRVWKPVDRVAARMLFGTSDDSANECEALSQFIRGLLKEHGPCDVAKITSAYTNAGFRTGRVGMALTALIGNGQIIKAESSYRLLIVGPEPVRLAHHSKAQTIQRPKISGTGMSTPASVLRAKYRAMGLKGRELHAAVRADLVRNNPLKAPTPRNGVPASVLRAKYRAMGLKGRELTAAVEAELNCKPSQYERDLRRISQSFSCPSSDSDRRKQFCKADVENSAR